MSLVKSYVRFGLRRGNHNKVDAIKGVLTKADGTVVAKKAGVYFKFTDDSVLAFGSIGDSLDLSYSEVKDMVYSTRGEYDFGQILLQVFAYKMPGIDSALKLALLHHYVSKDPPAGLVTNTLDYQVVDKLIIKLQPYGDNFCMTLHINASGEAKAVCDASKCTRRICGDVIRRRMVQQTSLIAKSSKR